MPLQQLSLSAEHHPLYRAQPLVIERTNMDTGPATRDLFRRNYSRLEQLCGEILPLPGLMHSRLHWHDEVLVLELIEENLYRSELLIYARLEQGESLSDPCPLFRVALQHERKWAEVLGIRDEYGQRGTQDAELLRSAKAITGMNSQFGLWLEKALVSGHQLSEAQRR